MSLEATLAQRPCHDNDPSQPEGHDHGDSQAEQSQVLVPKDFVVVCYAAVCSSDSPVTLEVAGALTWLGFSRQDKLHQQTAMIL